MGILKRVAAAIALALLAGAPTSALETDPYWSWGRPLEDVTDRLNAWFEVRLEGILEDVNRHAKGRYATCETVRKRTVTHLRTMLIHDLEVWVSNTDWIDRAPRGIEEERRYREEYLFASPNPFDTTGWLPPSPTVRVNGVRIGSDKLSHFVSEGWRYYRWSRPLRKRGVDETTIETSVIERGFRWEKTLLGKTSSGIFSVADAEANHAGYLFWRDFCGGEDGLLARGPDGWALARRFDFRRYVTPEWDESWQPNVYTRLRWKKVRPRLAAYCDRLEHPLVRAERESYARRDRETPTERVLRRFVREGRLKDPDGFSIERTCAGTAAPH